MEYLEDGLRVLAGQEQAVYMNGNIQAARQLLAELRDAYQCLPKQIQAYIARLLRECTPQTQPGEQRTG